FSTSSSLPSGNELRDRALRDYYDVSEDVAISSLARRLFSQAQSGGKLTEGQERDGEDEFVDSLTLEDVIALIKELSAGPNPTLAFFAERDRTAEAGPAVRSLRELVGALPGLVIVTVNFDELIE